MVLKWVIVGRGRENKGKEGGRRRLTDENLADGTTGRKTQDIRPHSRMSRHKSERVLELTSASRDVHAKPLADARMDKPGAQHKVRNHDEHAHKVICAHHLGASIRLERAKDIILCRIRKAVEQQIDA
ncbi:hypothetical protein RRF57_007709 [Xylaria bambusicola]|uniref:Uncharacterized protein n=1 Tax=Xylaria bambusicola TaxID=326684 RepID=A0AAN7UGK8_9PEZI